MFTEENPLKLPFRRPSETAVSEALTPESGFPSPFAVYLEDDYEMSVAGQGQAGRNSFCSQGSTATDTTNSTFSSSSFLSSYFQSFRSTTSNFMMSTGNTDNHDRNRNVKCLVDQTQQNTNSDNFKNKCNSLSSSGSSQNNVNERSASVVSTMRKDDLILQENLNGDSSEIITASNHVDYYFADPGLIAYLPEKLGSLMKEAIYLFNLKPNTAREFLISKKIISSFPSEFADFIFTYSSIQSKLSKRRIGEFVGNANAYNQDVLKCLLGKYNFVDMALDEAIRSLVRQFRLPGEAQQIDRILQKFAYVYYSQNQQPPGESETSHATIESADVAYVLSFSILILNTDLHNPSVLLKKKMTLEQFIKNNSGINNGADIVPDHLERLYARIKQDEIKMDVTDMLESDVPAFMAPIMAGYLSKLYHVALVPMWKKRWFILNDGCLYYFNKPCETKPKCIMPLENIRIEIPSSGQRIDTNISDDVTVKDDSRSSSMSNLFENFTRSNDGSDLKNDKNNSRGRKGRLSFTDNVAIDSGSYHDCILIVYGETSSGLLKSGKLSKAGVMTLAPRSKLVLRANSVAERDAWLMALQADRQNFDPLKNVMTAKMPFKMKGKINENCSQNPEESESSSATDHRTRYDVENRHSKDVTGDIGNLESYKCHRRCSYSSITSDNNEGSVVSVRSFISISSDHSITSTENSCDPSFSPDSNKLGTQGTKWGQTFGVNTNCPKSISIPYGSPLGSNGSGHEHGSESGSGLTKSKLVNISALPETDQSYGRFLRHASSSSTKALASNKTQSAYSASSEETMIGLSEVLLEGYIWRYTLEAKLHSTDPTGQSPDPTGSIPLQMQMLEINSEEHPCLPDNACLSPRIAVESPVPMEKRLISGAFEKNNTFETNNAFEKKKVSEADDLISNSPNLNFDSVERLLRTSSTKSSESMGSDVTTIAYTDSITTTDPLILSNSESDSKYESKYFTQSSIEQNSLKSLFPTTSSDSLQKTKSIFTALEGTASVSTFDEQTIENGEINLLEVSIPPSDYMKNNFNNNKKNISIENIDIATSASDLTGDSSFSVEYDSISDTQLDTNVNSVGGSTIDLICTPRKENNDNGNTCKNYNINNIQNEKCCNVANKEDFIKSSESNISDRIGTYDDNIKHQNIDDNVPDNKGNVSNSNDKSNYTDCDKDVTNVNLNNQNINNRHVNNTVNANKQKNHDLINQSDNKRNLNVSRGRKSLEIITNITRTPDRKISNTDSNLNPDLTLTPTSTSTSDIIPTPAKSPANSPYTVSVRNSQVDENLIPIMTPKSKVNQYCEKNGVETDNIELKYSPPQNSRDGTPIDSSFRRLRSPSLDLVTVRNTYKSFAKQNSSPTVANINLSNNLQLKDFERKSDTRRLSLHEKDLNFYNYSNSNKNNMKVSAIPFTGLKKGNSGPGSDHLCPSGVDISLGTNMGSALGSNLKYPGTGKFVNSENGLRDSQKWKRMYATLYADAAGHGDTLFYFPNEEV